MKRAYETNGSPWENKTLLDREKKKRKKSGGFQIFTVMVTIRVLCALRACTDQDHDCDQRGSSTANCRKVLRISFSSLIINGALDRRFKVKRFCDEVQKMTRFFYSNELYMKGSRPPSVPVRNPFLFFFG